MSKLAEDLTSKIEQNILRKLSVVFSIITICCLCLGIGIGFMFFGQKSKAETPENIRLAPEALSASFAEVARQVEPAVVNIDTKSKVPDIQLKGQKKPDSASPDDITEFFKRQSMRPSYSVGSGFIIDKSGYILTNYHVVDDAQKITITLQNNEEYTAKLIGADEETDVAVLKIEAGKDLPSVKLGDSTAAQVGDWVLAVGSPFGLAQTVTAGIISQTKRETPNGKLFQKFIQTDAAINRGNSGGPLVNMKGEVVGINSQIATSTGDYNGIGFALPSNEATYVYQQIIAHGKVSRGYLGIELDSVKPQFGKVYDMPEVKGGAIVTFIRDKESPAGKAGLKVYDVIVELNGQPVESSADLILRIALTAPGTDVNLTYLREVNNKLERMNATVKLGERPSTPKSSSDDLDAPKKLPVGEQAEPKLVPLGLTVQELTQPLATSTKLEGQKGLLIKEIDPVSFIADVKDTRGRDALNEGDLIQRVNRVTVTDVKSFNDVVSKLKTGDAVVLHVANYNARDNRVQQRIVQFTVQ